LHPPNAGLALFTVRPAAAGAQFSTARAGLENARLSVTMFLRVRGRTPFVIQQQDPMTPFL